MLSSVAKIATHSIVTTDANEKTSEQHDRMPAMLLGPVAGPGQPRHQSPAELPKCNVHGRGIHFEYPFDIISTYYITRCYIIFSHNIILDV